MKKERNVKEGRKKKKRIRASLSHIPILGALSYSLILLSRKSEFKRLS